MTRAWIIDGIGEASFEQLAATIPGTELQSLLLEVMRRRAAARTPRDLLAQYRRDRFARPATIDQRTFVELDTHLLAAAYSFEAIELSPVTPLGTSSVVGPSDQHRVLSALRSTEVVSDPTNVLALECAERLRAAPDATIHLATSQRVIRAQALPPDKPHFAAHFRIFCLASASRETKEHGFTIAAFTRHIKTMQHALDLLEHHGYQFGARRVDILATSETARVADQIADAVRGVRKPLDHRYDHGGIRYMLWVTAPNGEQVPLVDGGSFDWVAQLTSNRRITFITTGAGAQLMAAAFRQTSTR